MPDGVSAPTALSLEEVGVSQLLDAELPLPTANAWSQVGALLVALLDELADPRPDAYAKLGLYGPVYDLVYHGVIHVFPRSRDLGSVVSEQEIEVEVWNAYLAPPRAQVLDDITVTGPAGISVVDHLGVPADFAPTQSELFTVQVDAEGDPQIDNLIAWVFLGIDETGTALHVLGFRMIPYPFPPNMSEPVVETFGYLTDVLSSFSAMEQRVQLRAVPVGSIGYATSLHDRREAQMAAAILFGNQPRAFGVARWPYRTALTFGAAVDDLDIECLTADIPFEVGGLVMLWLDPFTWEVLTIESIAVDHLIVTSPVRSAWPAIQTTVVPMVVGRLSDNEAITWAALSKATLSLTFSVDGFRP